MIAFIDARPGASALKANCGQQSATISIAKTDAFMRNTIFVIGILFSSDYFSDGQR
jgi:hypothetical protein